MLKIGLFILAIFSANSSMALPLPGQSRMMSAPATFTNAGYDFEGIVALSNCSGSIVRFENSRDQDRAYVITNGHCLETGFPAPGTWVYGRPSNRQFRVLNPDGSNAGRVTANTVVYGTMTKTDLGLYRLNETYAEILQKMRVRPLTLSSSRSTEGTQMQVISGYWRRGYSCQVEQFITHLKEEGWVWDDSIRYSRPGCEVIGGTSGSPILQTGTRIVIGLNNTGNEDGESCTRNNPCEIDQNGNVRQTQGFSYGQQSYWLYSCLNSNTEVDLSTPGCLLPH